MSGPAANVTRAKEALQNKREELEKAQEDKKLRSYEEIVSYITKHILPIRIKIGIFVCRSTVF